MPEATAPSRPSQQRPDKTPQEELDSDLRGSDGEDTPRDLVRRAADKREELSADEAQDALEWFLSDEASADLSHQFEINVGSVEKKKWVKWTVGPVDLDQLRKIRQRSSGQSRAQRRSGNQDFDEVQANLQIVVEGTVSPDLRAAATQLGLSDPKDAVRRRFGHKPGLLTQIAGEVMAISGYDDEDIREVDSAKNS